MLATTQTTIADSEIRRPGEYALSYQEWDRTGDLLQKLEAVKLCIGLLGNQSPSPDEIGGLFLIAEETVGELKSILSADIRLPA